MQQQEEQDRREGRFPMDVEIKWQGDRLIVDGKDRTPPRLLHLLVPSPSR